MRRVTPSIAFLTAIALFTCNRGLRKGEAKGTTAFNGTTYHIVTANRLKESRFATLKGVGQNDNFFFFSNIDGPPLKPDPIFKVHEDEVSNLALQKNSCQISKGAKAAPINKWLLRMIRNCQIVTVEELAEIYKQQRLKKQSRKTGANSEFKLVPF